MTAYMLFIDCFMLFLYESYSGRSMLTLSSHRPPLSQNQAPPRTHPRDQERINHKAHCIVPQL